jgi:hypothetical protein
MPPKPTLVGTSWTDWTRLATDDELEEELEDPKSLAQEIWDTHVPENFKSLHLPTFDGKSDPLEHLIAVSTQPAIIEVAEPLKCKLYFGTLNDVTLEWYMNLPRNIIKGYMSRKPPWAFSINVKLTLNLSNNTSSGSVRPQLTCKTQTKKCL